MTRALGQQVDSMLHTWPVPHVSCFVLDFANGDNYVYGSSTDLYRYASVSKLASALTFMSAISEGVLALEDVTPGGLEVRDLLAHSSGLPTELTFGVPVLEQVPTTSPRTRRIYSNAGFELLAVLLERGSGMRFGKYMEEVLLHPSGMSTATVDPRYWSSAGPTGAAAGMTGTLNDLMSLAFVLERGTPYVDEALFRSAQLPYLPELPGVLPGFGEMERNLWGLGIEIKGEKSPHWTGRANSPETYGHFGAAGTFLWIDPTHALACGVLTDRDFGPWAQTRWPELSTLIVETLR